MIPRVDARELSLAEFRLRFESKSCPVILTHAINKWFETGEDRKSATWNLTSLSQLIGNETMKNVFLSSDRRFKYFKLRNKEEGQTEEANTSTRRQMRFHDFVTYKKSSSNDYPYAYLYGEALPGALRTQFVPFDLLDAKSVTSAMLWACGSQGQCSPLHYDLVEGFLAQVHGEKEVILIDPQYYDACYPHPSSSSHDRQSEINNVTAPNLRQYPMFESVPQLKGTLCCGEVLYIPIGWWHEISSTAENVSISYRWNPYADTIRGLAIAQHGVKSLPSFIQANILSTALDDSDLPEHVRELYKRIGYFT